MDRRLFLRMAAAAPASVAAKEASQPHYRVVTRYKPEGGGMPGRYAGRVISLQDPRSIDAQTEKVNPESVREMIRRGMTTLTGHKDERDSWAHLFNPSDVVGIKINASGAPDICSRPEVVGDIARNLVRAGVKPENIWIHERFQRQVVTVPYADFAPRGVHVVTADGGIGYDPFTFVDVNFFGEDDTRSNMVRLVTEKLTKIINVPNLKDHSASGVTGCLKNIAYGEFGNVARSHAYSQTHTLSFIGTLAAVEPLRSRTVLHIMDGLKGVWHGGPFSPTARYRFFPGRMLFGTDPVAMDRILLDIIEEKRKAEGANSVWTRDKKTIAGAERDFRKDPNLNLFLREPGHIEYAAKLGLGVYDKSRIQMSETKL